MHYSVAASGAGIADVPLISGIVDYIQAQPILFGVQLGGSLLVAVVCLRLARSLRRVTTESLHAGPNDIWGRLLGRIAYFSLLGLGLLLIAGIWGINGYQRALLTQLAHEAPGVARNVGLTLLVLALMLTVGRVLQRASMRNLARTRVDINLSVLVSRSIYFCALGVGLLIVLAVWNVELAVPVTVLGAVTVALTFSLQDLLKNLVAGVYLLIERPFRIGDEISVQTYEGTVEDIHMRVTTLRTVGGEQVLIPNGILFSSAVTNNSAYRRRRAALTVVLPEEEKTTEAGEAAILEALKTVDGILEDPPPEIRVSSAVDQKLTLLVHFWVPTERLDVLSSALFHVKRVLPGAEVSIPGMVGTA
ncbi:MAG TPA: mechanosensitive ion channel domain-containing protein [Ktedonobacterales bacterium]|nr:mechanosensitive ion channel domain-containing protein [Ktedonobacterales bacterium]